MSEDTWAIGVRAPAGLGRYQDPCDTCGALVNFADLSSRACTKKVCVQCFLAWLDAKPDSEPLQLIVTPENIALMRAFTDDPKGTPS